MASKVKRQPRRRASAAGAALNGDQPGLGQAERHNAIVQLIMSQGTVRIEELAERFGVSMMTIHRDLDTLETRGLLRKSRGVATAVATSLVEASTAYRMTQNTREKRALARAAFEFVEPGQAIIMDDSTTGLFLAELLPRRQPMSVITNFQAVLNALSGKPGVTLISLGGQYYQWCDAYMGNLTINAMRGLRADVLFMSTSAITDDVCFHQAHDTVLVKRAMFDSAKRRILYVDHTKFRRRALHALVALSEFDVVIVDDKTDPEDLRRLERTGVTVAVAQTNQEEEAG
jgi:DeoR/GlpR family transcriptional regulator of sugar metabolism